MPCLSRLVPICVGFYPDSRRRREGDAQGQARVAGLHYLQHSHCEAVSQRGRTLKQRYRVVVIALDAIAIRVHPAEPIGSIGIALASGGTIHFRCPPGIPGDPCAVFILERRGNQRIVTLQ